MEVGKNGLAYITNVTTEKNGNINKTDNTETSVKTTTDSSVKSTADTVEISNEAKNMLEMEDKRMSFISNTGGGGGTTPP